MEWRLERDKACEGAAKKGLSGERQVIKRERVEHEGEKFGWMST